MGFFQHRDYRDILREAYDARNLRNPGYSLRAFARDLGLSSSRLSEILQGRYGLSPAAALKIAANLKFSAAERDYFRDLVESRHARSRLERNAARERLARRSERTSFHRIRRDAFQVISGWHHFAILELLTLRGARSSASWIAERLEIPRDEALSAVERLLRLGYLRKDEAGNWLPTEDFTATDTDVPSRAQRGFHKQMLSKARVAIEEQPVAEREFLSLVLSMNAQDLPEAKETIRRFHDEFCARFGSGAGKDRVYCLGIQFHELGRAEEKKGNA